MASPPDDTPAADGGARPAGADLRHDLRTPINQIIGYSEMLEEDAAAAGQAKMSGDLKRIAEAARRMLELIDRIPDRLAAAPPAPALAAAPPPPARTARPAAADVPLPSEDGPGPATLALRAAVSKTRGESGGTLLVVDDNELNRDMLSRRLRSRGYEVVTAEDGQNALDLVKSRRFDLILLDIMMPVLSGLDVLKVIRATYSVAELPIIMATAKDQGTDVVEALRMGANDYVTKPLDFPVVLARAETQLSLKRAMEEIKRLANQLEKRNRFIKHTFGRYLSEEVVDRLLETPEGLQLGGEKREVTILLADLRGFTAMADRYTPEQVVRVLNKYLGTMADLIIGHQGTIDEFIGDAILAIFGAPETRPDDAARACACAVAMQLAMNEVNAFNRREGLPEVQMGIAVNTGQVIVGNIGSESRAKYGVVGTHVNLAGRIEGFTVGEQVLVSASTVAKAGEALELGQRVTFQAKGFKDPIDVYDLVGVGGSWNGRLPPRDDHLEPLSPALTVAVSVLEGKQMSDTTVPGTLLRASTSAATLRVPRPLSAFANLRLRLQGADGAVRPGDLYAKVVSGEPDADGGLLVRFTSADPEVMDALRQALAGSAK
ncbi:MAG: adenylate/guanylate cyclase domain-containing response regulator [Acidobacteria bacterium]|nr:MAG: adenylate/guanylate cyclase domain-containing response regulator [Acidobacteriota bacterium]